MKNIVKARLGRQGEANGDFIDELHNLVGPVETRLKLALRLLLQGGCCTLAKAKKGPIAHPIGHGTVAGVVEALLDRLRLFEAVTDVSEEFFTFLESLGDGSNPGLTRLIRPNRRGSRPYTTRKGVSRSEDW